MAHFAKIGLDYKVLEVQVVDNHHLENDDGVEVEQLGIDYLEEVTKYPYWVQTSYNGKFRARYAGITFRYDKELDVFIEPKPHTSWVLDEYTFEWESPIDYPDDGVTYFWDEEISNWSPLKEQEI